MQKATMYWVLVVVTGVLLLTTGCGGGGEGGTPSPPPGGGGVGGYKISGRVLDATNPNRGIAGAIVSLRRYQTRQLISSATTDSSGSYSLTADQGTYTLRVELPDGTYQAVEIELNVTGNVVMNVRLVPREIQIASVKIIVPPGDGPNGSYVVGKTYKFVAKAYDAQGNEITSPLTPNWQVEGGIGTISEDGTFTAKSPGVGKVKAIFTTTKYFEANITVSSAPTVNNPPKKPSLIKPDDQAIVTGTPEFRLSGTDPDGDRLRYKIEVLLNGAPFRTYDQTLDTSGWSKPDYISGETASFTPKSALPAGTYQWLAYAYDGRNWSEGSSVRTFIVNNPPTNLKMIAPDDNEGVSKTPTFKVSSTDIDGDRLRYKLEILKDGNVIRTYDGTVSQNGWDQIDYASGETAVLTIPDPLSIGTYQWRFRAYDGRSWSNYSSTRTFVISPLAIVVGSTSGSAVLIEILRSNGYDVSVRSDIPTDMGDADVLVIDEVASLNTSDASKVEKLFNEGRNIVLVGQAPVKIATGYTLGDNKKADISTISNWFGGATQMYGNDYILEIFAKDPQLFALPSNIKDGEEIYYQTSGVVVVIVVSSLSPLAKVAAYNTFYDGIAAFAYLSSTTGSRIYWQWHYNGYNPKYTKVDDLFIAGVNWATTGTSTKAFYKKGRLLNR